MPAFFRNASPNLQGILLNLLAILIFTLMDALAKHLILQGYHALQVVWMRYLGQTALITVLILPRLGTVLRTRHPVMQGLRSILQFASSAFFFIALPFISLASATAISDINPVLITLGAIAVSYWLAKIPFFSSLFMIEQFKIDLPIVAAFLTLIGFSVNDTIVIFDRIRENLAEDQKLGGHKTLREVINLSVNQTMSRTILTSGVTAFVVLAQFLVNWHTDSDLETFAFGMLVGMISGTYSTIWIAAPILTWVANREAKKPQKPAAPAPAATVPAQ